MARKLKVFRTAIGFRDAYVAAPSRAAALRAWGTGKDLFARGAAEEVTDPEPGEEALKTPGEVVYRTRGGLEEQVAALGKLPAKTRRRVADEGKAGETPAKKTRAKRKSAAPRPSRAELHAAEQALQDLEQERAAAEAAMEERERALKVERAAMERHFARERDARQRAEQKARTAYQAALERWQL